MNAARLLVHVHPTRRELLQESSTTRQAWRRAPSSTGCDTTRALIGVTFSGDAVRYPNIQFIWSHGGGAAPFLAGRIENATRNAADRLSARLHR